jgi:DNA repair exonuclease SbcCD ATPase subunit
MKPTKLTAKNFLSFKELSFDFASAPTLIVGNNQTDDNQISNGSGKSSLQAAIEFCLFAYTSRKVTDKKLIHFDEEKSELSLSINCHIRKQELRIERVIPQKGSGQCTLFINDNKVELATVKDCNDFIVQWIGIEKEDLSNYYIINKERFKSFFSSSNTQKIELISRFSRSNTLDDIDVLVKEDVSKLEVKLQDLNNSKNRLYGEIDGLEKQILTEEAIDFEEEKKKRISKVKESINFENENIQDHRESIESFYKKITQTKKEIISLNSELENVSKKITKENNPFDSLIESLNEEKSEMLSIQDKIDKDLLNRKKTEREVNLLLQEIRLNLSGTTHCPKCGHEFKVGEDVDIEEERVKLPTIESLLNSAKLNVKKVESNLLKIETEIEKIKDEIYDTKRKDSEFKDNLNKIEKEIDSIKDKINKSEKDVVFFESEIKNKERFIESCEKSILSYKERIESIKQEKNDKSRVTQLKQFIDKINIDIVNLEEKEKSLSDEIYCTNQWITNFKDFKFYLANESIKVIQGYCNKSLKEMGSDIQIMIEGYKTLSNGTIKEEITPYIIREEIRDFWSFSGGERARMEYAMIMSIQAMINATNEYGGLQFLSTDEAPSEGLDEEGIKHVIKSLSNYDFPILITTHVNNVKVNANTLTVSKVNGISTLNN